MNTWLTQHVPQSQKQALENLLVVPWMLFWLALFWIRLFYVWVCKTCCILYVGIIQSKFTVLFQSYLSHLVDSSIYYLMWSKYICAENRKAFSLLWGLGDRSACWLNIWVFVVYNLIALLFIPLLCPSSGITVKLKVAGQRLSCGSNSVWDEIKLISLWSISRRLWGQTTPPPPPLLQPPKSEMSDKAPVYSKKRRKAALWITMKAAAAAADLESGSCKVVERWCHRSGYMMMVMVMAAVVVVVVLCQSMFWSKVLS